MVRKYDFKMLCLSREKKNIGYSFSKKPVRPIPSSKPYLWPPNSWITRLGHESQSFTIPIKRIIGCYQNYCTRSFVYFICFPKNLVKLLVIVSV